MKIVKYDKARNTASTASGVGGGGSSTTIEGGGSVDLDREIWGKHDIGDDIDGSMIVNGDITIKAIDNSFADDEDDDEEGENEEYEEGGGNLNVELTTTTKDLEVANDAHIQNHLYINYNKNHSHSTNKKCVGEILNSIETDVEKSKTDIAANKTNITLIDKRVQELENKKQAGYYWSADANMNGSITTSPIEPVTFIGTDIGTFEVTETKPYLWRTTDGSSWVLVQRYLPPEPDKYYVCSTFNGRYIHSNGKMYSFPSGFCAFYTQTGTEIKLITPYGKDNWIPYTTVYQESLGNTIPTLNYPNEMAQTARGHIPRIEGYVYIYSIDNISDANDYSKWTLVQSGSSGGSTFQHSIGYADWGNSSMPPGYFIYEVNPTTNLVAHDYLGKNSNDPFISGHGNINNWKNETWRKSFLMHILSEFLYKNRGYYNSRLGWAFNYNGAANSIGYGGMWSCRMGGINAPTSNNPNDIGYYCTSSISYLVGYAYSTTTDNMPFKVEFRFIDVKLGKLTNYKPLFASAADTYDTSDTPFRFWDVEIGECTYKVTS